MRKALKNPMIWSYQIGNIMWASLDTIGIAFRNAMALFVAACTYAFVTYEGIPVVSDGPAFADLQKIATTLMIYCCAVSLIATSVVCLPSRLKNYFSDEPRASEGVE